MADLLQVSTLCLTYTPQRDVPPALVEEAKQGKLPMANKSAFPLVMRTGQGGMRVATALELADMYVAMVAIMDWDKRIDDAESDDDVDVTLTLQLTAVPEFLPELTVQTTLRDNPCLPEEDDEDDEVHGCQISLRRSSLFCKNPLVISRQPGGKQGDRQRLASNCQQQAGQGRFPPGTPI